MDKEQVKKEFENYRKAKRQHYFMLLALKRRRGGTGSVSTPSPCGGGDSAEHSVPLPSGQGPLRAAVPPTGFPLLNSNEGIVVKQSPKRDDGIKAPIDYRCPSSTNCDRSDGHIASTRQTRKPGRE
jgi:hypothetical protein